MRLSKKILTASISITIILFISSIVLELFKYNGLECQVLNFIENWFTGIACSLIVVIVTTYLQFKSEEQKIIIDFSVNITALLYKLTTLDDVFNDTEGIEEILNSEKGNKVLEEYYDNFKEQIHKCFLLSYEYCPFSKKKIKANGQLFNTLFSMQQILTSKENDGNKYKVLCALKQDIYIVSIAKNTSVLFDPKFLMYPREQMAEIIKNYDT